MRSESTQNSTGRGPKRRRESGFTLIEVLIAMAILAVGLLAIGVAQLSAIKMSSRSRSLSQAMYLAEQRMETFLARPATDAFFTTALNDFNDPNGPLDIDPTDDDVTTYSLSWDVEPDQPSLGLTRITVTVNWDTPSRAVHQVNLQGVKRRVTP